MITQPKLPPGVILPDPKEIAARIAEQESEDAAGRVASHNPIPGALADVWGKPQELTIGPYKLRAFTDGDFVALQRLNHPLMADATQWVPSGLSAWQVCWILTHTPQDRIKLLRGGESALNEAAEIEFGSLQIGQLAELCKGCLEQMTRAMAPLLAYKAKGTEGEQSGPPSQPKS